MSFRNVPWLAPGLITSLISRAFLLDYATHLALARFLRRETGAVFVLMRLPRGEAA
jgi:hypothetical protein